MLTLHHLVTSRSSRVIWLLEALGLKYELVTHQRGPDYRALPDLAEAHPLGKAPTLRDGELVLFESAAILRHVATHYGNGRFTPPPGTDAFSIHDQWLDFAEGSFMMPMMIKLLGRAAADGLPPALEHFATPEYHKFAAYLGNCVSSGGFLLGPEPMLADIQMSYCLAVAEAGGLLQDHPKLQAYWQHLQAEPGYKRMIEIGGPLIMNFSR
jgi:glutathione S-transferase